MKQSYGSFCLILFLLITQTISVNYSQSAHENLWSANDNVMSTFTSGNIVYIGGVFTLPLINLADALVN